MKTEIQYNGSGFRPDTIEVLYETLQGYALDPRFEDYGDFCQSISDYPWGGPGKYRFWGNFLHLSHVFSIDTDDVAVIEKLNALIAANKQMPEYQKSRKQKLASENQRHQKAYVKEAGILF